MSDDLLIGRRVLVVEDEYLMAADMAQAFEEKGAEVIGPAPSVDRATALIDAQPHIHAAVLDVNLAGELIYPVADVLNARGVPFVFSTGYDQGVIPPRFHRVPRLEKPVGPEEVVRAVCGLVGC